MNRAKKIVHYQKKWLGKGCVVAVMDTGEPVIIMLS